jgi:hypothetical protein
MSSDDDIAFMLLVRDGGSVHSWGRLETAEQRAWARGLIDNALLLALQIEGGGE